MKEQHLPVSGVQGAAGFRLMTSFDDMAMAGAVAAMVVLVGVAVGWQWLGTWGWWVAVTPRLALSCDVRFWGSGSRREVVSGLQFGDAQVSSQAVLKTDVSGNAKSS